MKPVLLVAERDPDLLEAYDRLGSACGFAVETANAGLECLCRVSGAVPDAVVVDLGIPWGCFAAILLRLPPDPVALAPIVFVTGCGAPHVLAQRCGIPPGNCFQKPFRMTKLLECICAAIDAERRFVEHAPDELSDAGGTPPRLRSLMWASPFEADAPARIVRRRVERHGAPGSSAANPNRQRSE